MIRKECYASKYNSPLLPNSFDKQDAYLIPCGNSLLDLLKYQEELEREIKEHRIEEPDPKDYLSYRYWVAKTQDLLDVLKLIRDSIVQKKKEAIDAKKV